MSVSRPSLSRIRSLASAALSERLHEIHPDIDIDDKGYVPHFSENLLLGVEPEHFEVDLRQGDGNELETKFRAAHSSSALVVNTFALFRDRPGDLMLCDLTGFENIAFERKCPTGLRGGRSPNLDVVAERPGHVVAVESKCLEYLSPHTAKFSPAYREQIKDGRREGLWFAAMLRALEQPNEYRHLDVAQLIKHAFGLAPTFPGQDVTLLYLYWEPANANVFDVFHEHRAEIERFAECIRGATPRFRALSYPALWSVWSRASAAGWLGPHVESLRERYLVTLGAQIVNDGGRGELTSPSD